MSAASSGGGSSNAPGRVHTDPRWATSGSPTGGRFRVNKNDGQRYYSNVESLILINHLSNNNDRSSQIIDDLCHTIDLTKIKSLKFDNFDHLQSTSIINIMNFIPNLLELKIIFKIYLQHQYLISKISTISILIFVSTSNNKLSKQYGQ